jgi:fucose permease
MTDAALAPRATWSERAATEAIFLVHGVCTGAWAASIPYFKAELSLSNGELSIALFAFAVGAVAAMLAAPPFAHWLGSARAPLVAAFAFAALLLVPLIAKNLPTFTTATFALGAARGLLDVTMNAHATSIERRWGAAIMSSFHAGFSAGGLLGAAVGGALGGAGPAWILGVGASIAVALALAAVRPLQSAPAAAAAIRVRLAFPARAALPICLAAMLSFTCEGAMADWTSVYLRTVAAAPNYLAPAGYAAFSAAMLIGRATGDAIVRAYGPARVVAAGGSLACLGLIIAVAAPSVAPASFGFALVGLGMSNVVPTLFAAAARLGVSPAAGVAMAATAGYAGLLGAPPIIGAIAQIAGLRASLGFVVILAAGIALTSRAFERR